LSPSAGPLSAALIVRLPTELPKRHGQRPEGFYDSDEWSWAGWQTISDHTEDVVRELATILHPDNRLSIPQALQGVLKVAARWHDWGKAHEVFQSGVADVIHDPRDKEIPAAQRRQCERRGKWKGCSIIAKAPAKFWRRYRRTVRPANPDTGEPGQQVRVKRFRHELASALGILALERAGVPRPRPLSVTSRVISASCRARAMVTAVARALGKRRTQVQRWLRVELDHVVEGEYRQTKPGRPGPNTQYRRSERHCFQIRFQADGVALARAGRRDGIAVGGHLFSGIVRPTLEVQLIDYGATLERKIDPPSRLPLF